MHGTISLHVLASGSKGNSSVVVNEATGQSVLIDCGCRRMDLAGFFNETAYDPRKVEGILITHDHSDHIKSLAMLMRYLHQQGAHPLVHTLEPLIAPCRAKTDTEKGSLAEYEAIRFEDFFEIAGLRIAALPTSHDATASCGFYFESTEAQGRTESIPLFEHPDSLAFITDTGVLPAESASLMRHARLLALECNHDEKMLKYGDYPRFLKERIASDKGHLSNAQASQLIREYVGSDCEAFFAMHLSQENNLASIARETVQSALDDIGSQAQLLIARQTARISSPVD